jgi:predicted nucleotide-binding protein
MAHQKTPPVSPLGSRGLTQSRAEAASRLQERINLGRELQRAPIGTAREITQYEVASEKWTVFNNDLLKAVFISERIAREYRNVSLSSRAAKNDWDKLQIRRETIDGQIEKLESIHERLELYDEPTEQPEAAGEVLLSRDPSKVFVVHGHDEAASQTMARFLQKIELKAIILKEQPDQGFTIIEKFESYAGEVSFAVVLLTPDDVGGLTSGVTQTTRARQNVIFELGCFAGKLGRGKVCLLRKGEVEMPSDLYGVIYIDMDAAEGWKLKLIRELRTAELDFDANKVWE